jgi:hypothetical protein
MRYSELNEGLTIKEILNVTWAHYRKYVQTDDYETKAEFLAAYREVKAELVFPRLVYRGLANRNIGFDARYDDISHLDPTDEYEAEKLNGLTRFAQSLDFSRIGTCWTWDQDCAAAGGMLDECEPSIILVAKIKYADVDFATTLWQNLTVYQEEKEIRLLPNRRIQIIGATPALLPKLPISANTGPPHGDEAKIR